MKRGEVWWANLPRPAGHRPVLLVSRDEAYAVRTLVMIADVSTHVRGIEAEVRLGPADGLSRVSAANLESITTVPKAWIHEYITTLSPQKMEAVDAALRFAFGLDD